MKSQYIVKDFDHTLGHLVEECGEVLAASGKTLRWGWASYNPELPEAERESNLLWLMRELSDLKEAIANFEEVVESDELP